ncbi:MAG: class I SAM-dependent methyltransferase [Anaerolineales bacterium]|nr:class I SAM-dependent methyltransferase [Anaerolineales bacterium]
MELQNISTARMYGDLAWLWPYISRKEHYMDEAATFRRLIGEHTRIETHTLLHLGCGGGHLDYWLKHTFQVTGVDLSDGMLENARRLNPELRYQQGDMRSLRLGQAFDAVICADSIDYMLSEDDLKAVFETAFWHLKPGGIFCTYAEYLAGSFPQNSVDCSSNREGDIEVAFFENYYDPDPTDTTCEFVFVYLIRQAGKLTIESDRHIGGLFPLETWLRLLKDVGFLVHQVDLDGLIHFVCQKPAQSST